MSIAGGYYKAVNAAAELKMDCVQLFTKNNNQWKGKPLSDDDVRLFREAIDRTGIILPCAHDSYLINVASPDDALWVKSRDALLEEVHRAEALGLAGLVMHPGSFTTSSEEEGLDKVVTALDWVHQAAPEVFHPLCTERNLESVQKYGNSDKPIGWFFKPPVAVLHRAAEAAKKATKAKAKL